MSWRPMRMRMPASGMPTMRPSVLPGLQKCGKPVRALADVLPQMEAFHRRYMVSNKILRLWADMVSGLPIKMLVPQHGAPLVGPAVGEFIAWVRELPCGIDLFSARNYVLP